MFYGHCPLTIVIGPGEYTYTNTNLCPLCVALDEPRDREPFYRAEYQCMRDLGNDARPADSTWGAQCSQSPTRELPRVRMSVTDTLKGLPEPLAPS
jgi:hypothetical protein